MHSDHIKSRWIQRTRQWSVNKAITIFIEHKTDYSDCSDWMTKALFKRCYRYCFCCVARFQVCMWNASNVKHKKFQLGNVKAKMKREKGEEKKNDSPVTLWTYIICFVWIFCVGDKRAKKKKEARTLNRILHTNKPVLNYSCNINFIIFRNTSEFMHRGWNIEPQKSVNRIMIVK